MKQKVNQKIEKKLKEGLDRIIPQLFRPKPRFVPTFIWKRLFYLIVRKDVLIWKNKGS